MQEYEKESLGRLALALGQLSESRPNAWLWQYNERSTQSSRQLKVRVFFKIM